MTLLHVPAVLAFASRHMLCRVEGVADRFGLTFDDGPSPRNTPRLLDVLAAHDARATFFMLARAARAHPALARRVAESGHEIGLHGDDHRPLLLLSTRSRERYLAGARAALSDATGAEPRLLRPPFGYLTPAQARALRRGGLEPVLGDVYPQDPRRPGVHRIVRRVLRRLRPGSILILHDGGALRDADREQTIRAVSDILDAARARGLRAVTVSDLARQITGAR